MTFPTSPAASIGYDCAPRAAEVRDDETEVSARIVEPDGTYRHASALVHRSADDPTVVAALVVACLAVAEVRGGPEMVRHVRAAMGAASKATGTVGL